MLPASKLIPTFPTLIEIASKGTDTLFVDDRSDPSRWTVDTEDLVLSIDCRSLSCTRLTDEEIVQRATQLMRHARVSNAQEIEIKRILSTVTIGSTLQVRFRVGGISEGNSFGAVVQGEQHFPLGKTGAGEVSLHVLGGDEYLDLDRDRISLVISPSPAHPLTEHQQRARINDALAEFGLEHLLEAKHVRIDPLLEYVALLQDARKTKYHTSYRGLEIAGRARSLAAMAGFRPSETLIAKVAQGAEAEDVPVKVDKYPSQGSARSRRRPTSVLFDEQVERKLEEARRRSMDGR